mgnify:CR=1 FL=1
MPLAAAEWDAILPPGLTRTEGEAPPPPSTYEEGYALPQHSAKPLLALHPDPQDARLVFHEAPHVYTWDGTPASASVTALAHQYEKPFVAADAIAGMKTARTQAWPRLEYVEDAQPLGDAAVPVDRGVLLTAGGKTLAALQPHAFEAPCPPGEVRDLLHRLAPKVCEIDDAEVHTFARERTAEEISSGWKRKGMIASHRGTEAHYQAELYFNGLPCRMEDPEVAIVRDFCARHLLPRGIVAHATEKEIYCADADLAGSIDLILWDGTRGVYHIVDHKRSDKLQSDLRGYGKMLPPFSHLDDCKGAAYALQTSIYQYILERDYGMTFGERILLSLHPDRPFTTAVPYLCAEVEHLMAARIELVRARRAVAADPRFRCALSGAPLVDAVTLRDGRCAMEKAALVHGESYTVDATTRAAFEAAVADARAPVADFVPGASWRRQMPVAGLPPFGA